MSTHAPDAVDVVRAFAALQRRHTRLLEALAAESAITVTDLRAVARLVSEGPATPKVVAEHLGLTPGSMTTLVDRLETARLVTREPNPGDRRSLLVKVTPEGSRVGHRTIDLYARALTGAAHDGDLVRVHDFLLRTADALQRSHPQDGEVLPLTAEIAEKLTEPLSEERAS